MSEKRICKYCGVELPEDIPHGLRECHLYAVARIVELERQTRPIEDALNKRIAELLERQTRPIEDALNKRIAELEEKQRWRVVANGELPEVYRDEDGEFIPFLVCEGDGDRPFIAMYGGTNWHAGIFVPDVTHWMPLPELPEVQE